MRRRFGRRGTGGGKLYGGTLGLVFGAVGLGALVLFLLRRSRGEDVRESVERVSETVQSRAEEYTGTPSRETERPADGGGGVAAGAAEDRRRTVRKFADRLEEQRPADREEEQGEKEASEGAREDTREELRSIVRESVRRSEESSRPREEGRSEETAEEQEGRTGERSGAGSQMTVVGVLAKMGEAFEETGGGRFMLSTEDEGNFDLHGKEDELDEIYQQQIQAEVVGRITEGDAQPRVMEVDEVRSA